MLRKKTNFEKAINYIKNIFRSKDRKKSIVKFYSDGEVFFEKFATINEIKIGELKDGLCAVSFSGFKK